MKQLSSQSFLESFILLFHYHRIASFASDDRRICFFPFSSPSDCFFCFYPWQLQWPFGVAATIYLWCCYQHCMFVANKLHWLSAATNWPGSTRVTFFYFWLPFGQRFKFLLFLSRPQNHSFTLKTHLTRWNFCHQWDTSPPAQTCSVGMLILGMSPNWLRKLIVNLLISVVSDPVCKFISIQTM